MGSVRRSVRSFPDGDQNIHETRAGVNSTTGFKYHKQFKMMCVHRMEMLLLADFSLTGKYMKQF